MTRACRRRIWGVPREMIELRGLSTAYGSVPMLRDVDIDVAPDEVVCVLGPNGAGKTTLFKTIAGLVAPTSGSVRVMGADVRSVGAERLARHSVGFVPEGRRLFPGLTVKENILLGYDAVQPDRSKLPEGMALIERTFPRVAERMRRAAGTLSGGEQAMVALARALVGQPRLLIMDEPSLGLSPKLIRQYFETLALVHDSGVAMLLIEQNAEMALRIASRGYVIARGRVVASDRSQALRASSVVRSLYFG